MWTNREPLPSGRGLAFHSLAAYQGALFAFGGTSGALAFSNALLKYTIGKRQGVDREGAFRMSLCLTPGQATNSWQAVTPIGGSVPPARAGHAAFVLQDRLYVFGGATASGVLLADAWSFSFVSNAWTQLSTAGANAIGARFLHTAVAGPQANSVCLFGGASAAATALVVGATAPDSNALYCYDAVANTWLPTRSGPAGGPASLAALIVLRSQPDGFTVQGGVVGGALSARLLSYVYASSTWTTAAAPAIAYAASAPTAQYGYYFGGIRNAAGQWNTRVMAVGPAGVWAEVQVQCEKGYTGATCTTPVCQNACWNLGRCIAPDLCECREGFTGALCTQQTCATCNVNWLDLNQQILWPRAKASAYRCMNTLLAQVAQIQALLPAYAQRCGQTDQYNYPVDLQAVSRQAWQFDTQVMQPLAALSAATAELLRLQGLK